MGPSGAESRRRWLRPVHVQADMAAVLSAPAVAALLPNRMPPLFHTSDHPAPLHTPNTVPDRHIQQPPPPTSVK